MEGQTPENPGFKTPLTDEPDTQPTAWSKARIGFAAAGFTPSEIDQVGQATHQHMTETGAAPDEVEDFFGLNRKPIIAPIQNYFDKQFKGNLPAISHGVQPPDTLFNAIKSGWDSSVSGLAVNREEGNPSLTDQSSTLNRVASGIAQGAGDLPAYAMGAVAGGIAGAPAGPVGVAVGGASLGMGFPQALRAAMVENYKHGGGIQTFEDLMDVVKVTAVEGGKGMLTGALSAPFGYLGGLAGKSAGNALLNKAAGTIAEKSAPYVAGKVASLMSGGAEAAAMTSIGAALDGHMPKLQDFTDNAMTLVGSHYLGINHVQGKMMNSFSSTGLHPEEISQQSRVDPVLKQEMLSRDSGTPDSLSSLKQPVINNSTFAVVDGRLVRADDPKYHAQLGFNFGPTSRVELQNDSQKTFSDENMRTAARAHDPETFRQLDQQSAQIKAGKSQLKTNEEHLKNLGAGEARSNELEEIQGKLANPEKFTSNKEEHSALREREQELLKTRRKDRDYMEAAKAVRDHNELIKQEVANIKKSPELVERLMKAHEMARETLRNNFKDRISNQRVVLEDAPGTDLLPGLNPEYNRSSDEMPEMTDDGKKILLEDNHALDQYLEGSGFAREHTREEALSNILKDHPELAAQLAPEITHTIPGEMKVDADGKVTEGEPTTYVAAKALDLGEGKKEPGLVVRPSEPWKMDVNPRTIGIAAERAFVSKLAPWHALERGTEKHLRLATDIAHQNASRTRALEILERGVLGDGMTRTSKGLNELFKFDTLKEREDFAHYLVADQGIRELQAGRKAGNASMEELQGIVEKHREQFKDRAAQIHDFLDKFLDYTDKKGLLTEGTAARFRESFTREYLPLNHLLDNGTSLGGRGKADVFAKRQGSEKDFLDPYESIRNKVVNTMFRIEMNENANKALELNDSLPEDMKILHEVSPGLEDPEVVRSGTLGEKLKENEVAVVRDGKYGVMRFKDPELAVLLKTGGVTGKEVKNAMQHVLSAISSPIQRPEMSLSKPLESAKNLGIAAGHAVLKTPELLANATRSGVSLSSKFAPVHIVRQEVEGWLLSRSSNVDQFVKKLIGKENATPEELRIGRIPFATTMHTLTGLVYDRFIKGTPIDAHPDIVRARIHKSLDGVMSEVYENLEKTKKYHMGDEYGGISGAHNVIKSVWGMNHALIDVWSKAQRLSEFKMLEEHKSQELGRELTDSELTDLGKQSRGVSVDALEKGAVTSFISKYSPFTTYGTNGFFNTLNAYKEDPINASLKTALFLTAVAGVKYANRKDDEINQVSRETQDNYTMIRLSDGVVARIPKSWGAFKVLSSLLERGMDHFAQNDPDAFKGMGDTFLRDLPFPAAPSVYNIYQALHNNYNTYTHKAQIPEHMMKNAPEDRVHTYTSQVARGIGHAIEQLNGLPVLGKTLNSGINSMNLGSPVNLDYMVSQLGGARGEALTHLIDTGLAKSGKTPDNAYASWELSDLPYVGGLIQRNPTYNAQALTGLREKISELAPYAQSIKDAEKEGLDDKAETIRSLHPELVHFDDLKSAAKDVAENIKQLRGIDGSEDMTPTEKKRASEDIYKVAWMRAKEALETINKGEE